jgi:hypothetical protein
MIFFLLNFTFKGTAERDGSVRNYAYSLGRH